ncbi:MAG TPA: hypothetical protein EYP30_05815, partial [Archaeoglobaceae archaeon]|nr:hypothetical protein [Archaeoglobaceae archaeon]
ERFKEFSYTYLDRFSCQLKPMEEKIRSIGSRRCLMISWQPAIDLRSDSPPCCQIVQLFNLNGKEVEGFVIFRSNDFYNAWQSNLIGLVYMIDKYILSPNKLKLTHLIYFSTIAHIYAEFLEEAKKLELIPNFRGV